MLKSVLVNSRIVSSFAWSKNSTTARKFKILIPAIRISCIEHMNTCASDLRKQLLAVFHKSQYSLYWFLRFSDAESTFLTWDNTLHYETFRNYLNTGIHYPTESLFFRTHGKRWFTISTSLDCTSCACFIHSWYQRGIFVSRSSNGFISSSSGRCELQYSPTAISYKYGLSIENPVWVPCRKSLQDIRKWGHGVCWKCVRKRNVTIVEMGCSSDGIGMNIHFAKLLFQLLVSFRFSLQTGFVHGVLSACKSIFLCVGGWKRLFGTFLLQTFQRTQFLIQFLFQTTTLLYQ